MKKVIAMSICTISVLYAVPNDTKETAYGLYFGSLDQATYKSGPGDRSRVDVILGCMHANGGSERMAVDDCAQITQVYKAKTDRGILYKNNEKIDNYTLRDNIWCMESSNTKLGSDATPNVNDFVSDINSTTASNILRITQDDASVIKNNHKTSVYKYEQGYYQESYKNISVDTTGRLRVVSNGDKPFSFYLARNFENRSLDVYNFVKDYVGIQSGFMTMDYSRKDEGAYNGLYSVNWSRNSDGSLKDRPYTDACNYYGYYESNRETFRKNGNFGCNYFKNYSNLNQIERYVRFYYSLANDYGCTIHETNANDIMPDNQRPRGSGIEFYAVTNDKNEKLKYRIMPSGALFNQYNSDRNNKYNNKGANLGKLINGSNSCKMAVEGITVKNLLTYSPAEFNHGNRWEFLNQETSGMSIFNTRKFGWSNTIGKCYFANMQYYDRRDSENGFTPFEALTAFDFFYGNNTKRFLQNSLNNAVATYSIHRATKGGIYTSNKVGVEHAFTLNTRPTSFRGKDISDTNTKNGTVNADYELYFYPDATGVVKTAIFGDTRNIAKIGDNSYDLVTSLEFGVDNNVQLQFTYQNHKNSATLIDVDRLKESKFKFTKGKIKIEGLKKSTNGYVKTGKQYNRSFNNDSNKIVDYMALRVDNAFLNTIGYSNEPILVTVDLEEAVYADDDRPFYSVNGDTIINANSGIFEVIIDLTGFKIGDGTEFGTVYNKINPNSNETPDINSPDVVLEDGKAYTRIVGNPVFIGIKNLKYTNTNKIDNDDIIISFTINKDGNTNSDIPFSYKINKDTSVNILENSPLKEKNVYPYRNGVIELRDAPVGKYEVCYQIYSKKNIEEAKKIANFTPKMDGDCTNTFSIRPAYIDYRTDKNYDAGALKQNGEFTAVLRDNKGNKIINTPNEFGLIKATLNVKDSNTKDDDSFATGYNFDLNGDTNKTIDDNNIVDFVKNGDTYKVVVGMQFPFSTDTKLRLTEGKFTLDDSKDDLCNKSDLTGKSSDILATANKIGKDGKIYCVTPSNGDLAINFKSTADYKLSDPVLKSETPVKVFFTTNASDGHKLAIPFVLNNNGNFDLKYVYKKFNNPYTFKYELNFDNKDKQALERYLINVGSRVNGFDGLKTLIKIDSVAQDKIKITSTVSEYELNKKFDTKLKEFNNDVKTNNIADVMKSYEAEDGEIVAIVDLAYSKYYKTKANETIDSISLLNKPMVGEFKLLKGSTATLEESGKEIAKSSLKDDYSFIFTGATYKDTVAKKGDTAKILENKDLEVYYLDENSQKRKLTSAEYTNFANISTGLDINTDYNSDVVSGSDIEVRLNKDIAKKEYVKEVVNIKNSEDFHGGSFTIEFKK